MSVSILQLYTCGDFHGCTTFYSMYIINKVVLDPLPSSDSTHAKSENNNISTSQQTKPPIKQATKFISKIIMVNIRQATANDLLYMQMTNLWCLPENYQVMLFR